MNNLQKEQIQREEKEQMEEENKKIIQDYLQFKNDCVEAKIFDIREIQGLFEMIYKIHLLA